MNEAKGILSILLAVTLIFSSAIPTFGDTVAAAVKPGARKVLAYLKPDVTVMLYGEEQAFCDVNAKDVYPIIYNGSTYLPVRAISELMEENVEWNDATKTVFIGKTLANPNKVKYDVDIKPQVSQRATQKPEAQLITVYLKPDVIIQFDFIIQTFTDELGNTVYPIIYEGSTYLPVRAISKLMQQPIEWDAVTKTVLIGEEQQTEGNMERIDSEESIAIQRLFEEAVSLYDQATAKISRLNNLKTIAELERLSSAVSADYAKAEAISADVRLLGIKAFTDEEETAYKALSEFTTSTEYYILVMENIVYMAMAEVDYSVLADTFLEFAMASSQKMDQTRAAIKQIPQIQVIIEETSEGK